MRKHATPRSREGRVVKRNSVQEGEKRLIAKEKSCCLENPTEETERGASLRGGSVLNQDGTYSRASHYYASSANLEEERRKENCWVVGNPSD